MQIFGSTSTYAESKLVYLPIPLEATASYGRGTSDTPASLAIPSLQVDLDDINFGNVRSIGMHTLLEDVLIKNANRTLIAGIDKLRHNPNLPEAKSQRDAINDELEKIHERIYLTSAKLLDDGKYVGLIGGDHSCPFGLIKALSERQSFGILHIDAHFDLRDAFQGYRHSHGSIMYNVRQNCPGVSTITHVGIRDFCIEEKHFCEEHPSHQVFYDWDLATAMAEGEAFASFSKRIVSSLPERVYVSFDIDGLDPALCPGTGTPVGGGLSFHQMTYLLVNLLQAGKKIVGFDLCEVSNPTGTNEWNLNVGCRVLYKLSALLARSQGLV